jgi:sigma-B regulation protein RsbU (phosphoserine phosphatase)
VGGDYYDVIPIDENRLALAIGDVSGKGVPASLLMANLQSALRVMMVPEVNLAEVVEKLNTLIYNNTGLDKFITFFIGILNTKKHTLEYVNAGHNNPILCSPQNEMRFLDIGGIILGIMPGYSYNTGSISLKKGDFILTYTDGVNEAINPGEEEFGEERLYELVKSHTKQPVKQIVENVWQAIDKFAAGYPQADDVTMLAVRRLP